MLDIEIIIELYDKSFSENLIDIIKRYDFDKPVYIVEYSDRIYFRFNTDYHQWELQKEIVGLFDGYSFSESVSHHSEIILKIQRVQSSLSTDNWGGALNTDNISMTVYLTKDTTRQPELIDSSFIVLFGNTIKEYQVHLASGKDPKSGNPFYVVLKEPFTAPDKAVYLIQQHFTSVNQAFWEGVDALSLDIEKDFEAYQKMLKAEKRKKRRTQ